MNVNTITITADEASRKLAAYKQLTEAQRTMVDDQLIRLYRMVQSGARVINIEAAFKQTGLNEQGQPKLAIARADWERVTLHTNMHPGIYSLTGGGTFAATRRLDARLRTNCYKVPRGTWPGLTIRDLHAPVPHVPPSIRPRTHLRNYHILFEVERWEEYPVDPFLLRHIHGALYVIEAEWELTTLEASLLSALSA